MTHGMTAAARRGEDLSEPAPGGCGIPGLVRAQSPGCVEVGAVHDAVQLLRTAGLRDDYAAAWAEWQSRATRRPGSRRQRTR